VLVFSLLALAWQNTGVTDTPQGTPMATLEYAAMKTTGNAPARDGNIAIREELDAAIRENTAAAFNLFILRHPDHELAETAKEFLRKLTFENN
jgi:hypothetical protein